MRILVFSLAVLSAFNAFSQNYEPLLNEMNEWHFTNCFGSCTTVDYFTDGDTTVNGEVYKILDGYHYVSRTFLLREDSNARKVYMGKIDPGTGTLSTYLLYNFALQEGDTTDLLNPFSPFPLHVGYFRLDSIRIRTLSNGNAYRHFYFAPTASNTQYNSHPVWVEGVGSLSLINAPGGEPDINNAGQLSCFFKNSDLFYADLDSIQGCVANYYLGVEEVAVGVLSIFPNPSKGNIMISGKEFSSGTWKLFNALGNEVAEKIISGKGEVFWETGLPSGVYWLLAPSLNAQPYRIVITGN